jgi:hypothetical protein
MRVASVNQKTGFMAIDATRKIVGSGRQGRALIPLNFLPFMRTAVGPGRQVQACKKTKTLDFIDEFRWHANWVQKATQFAR